MAQVAVLGLGAMGSRMARNLLAAGHTVAVWNRTPAVCLPLAEAGAALADSPRAAAAGADFVIAMLRDDVASQAVWLHPDTGALAGMRPGAIAIESSTLTIGFMRHLAAQVATAGFAFLDAPVAGSRPQAEAAQLIYLVGGDASVLAQADPVLRAMGNTIHYAGSAGNGAAIKLAVNTLLGVQVAAMAEIIGLFEKTGLDPARATDILTSTPVCSPAAKGAAASMLAGTFAPMFPAALAEKDFGYTIAAAAAVGAAMPIAESTRAVLATAITGGFGPDHLTGVVRLYR
jgi:3-hydroxyisobutyrate dehydrogenase